MKSSGSIDKVIGMARSELGTLQTLVNNAWILID